MTRTAGIIHRLVDRDRQLLDRLMLDPEARLLTRAAWTAVTHAGGAVVTIAAAVIPLSLDGSWSDAARRTAVLLAVSHVIVQVLKRCIVRPRPQLARIAILRAPDRFSFPSGHAAASLSVALGYASMHPALAVPLVMASGLVGASRVVLGVHFPADVIAGQLVAILTAIALAPLL